MVSTRSVQLADIGENSEVEIESVVIDGGVISHGLNRKMLREQVI